MGTDRPSRTATTRPRRTGFMRRLLKDASGNTLAIVGAALVPLTAIIGSGVDMSRAYMAKTRLQSACDAASLAGRRVMSNDTIDDTVRQEATRFFQFNFPQGMYETEPYTLSITRPEAGTVRVATATAIPTAVMRIFGFTTLPLSVTCDASLNFVNTDIILVLDVTGSMLQDVNGNSTGNSSNRKITALREAVMALYDELRPIQTQLEANGLRLRYGIVPYSSAVNVGHLIRGVNPDYIRDDAEYHTRVANYNTPVHTPHVGEPGSPVVQQYPSSISQSDCDRYGRNVRFGSFSPSATTGGGPAPNPTWTRTYSNNEATGVDWGWPGSDTSGSTRSCRRRYVETETTYTTEYRFTNWVYEAESIDLTDFKSGSSVQYATSNNGRVATPGVYDMQELAQNGIDVSTSSTSWRGCIEERDTVHTITASSGYTIPNNAYDLQINLVPHNDATRWRPHWPQIVHRRSLNTTSASSGTAMASQDESYWACPNEARRLAAFSRTAMESYVNGLDAIGGTYHDIGMLWGARLISPGGIFGDSPSEYNGMPVSRHIIFMTDGQLAPNSNTYTTYGMEDHDKRVTGSHTAPQQEARHLQRFKMICNATKSMNVSIWVVAFATSLSNEMRECASNENQASISANRDQLIERFRQIGANIGALRLVQ